MTTLINRIQRAFLGSAGPEKVRALLVELAIPAGGSGQNALREARRGFLRPISDEEILRDALAGLGLTGGGSGARPLTRIRSAILHNLADSESTLRDGLNDLLAVDDLGDGGGEESWVPEGAKIHIDFVGGDPQGRAWVDGTGEVAVDTLLGADPNTENAWGVSAYDPDDLVATGLAKGAADPVAFIGAARTKLLLSGTVVFNWTVTIATTFTLGLVSADGSDGLWLDQTAVPANGALANIYSDNGSLNLETGAVINFGETATANCCAITLTSDRFEAAFNGVSDDILEGEIDATDRPPGNLLVAVFISLGSDDIIQSITIYDALSDTTGLSALSETGVANTAPAAVTSTWVNVAEGDPTHATITVAAAEPSTQVIDNLVLVDSEGNPGTWTLPDDDAGNFEIVSPNRVQIALALSEGVHSFTVRGTDPGGLYVEQGFTITVTA